MTTKLVTVDEMRRLEAEANALGVSYAAMMDDAGQAVAEAVLAKATAAETTAVILLGKGNNGGDGLVCARYLHDAGVIVKVYGLQPPDEADFKVVALRARQVFMVDAENDMQSRVLKHLLNGATVVIDAVFGTGVRLPLEGKAAQLLGQAKRILETRETKPLRVAVDVPSGIDSDSGQVDANTLKADITVTFGAAKVGQYQFPAADYLGELRVALIGWPETMPGLKAINFEVAGEAQVRAWLPKRTRESHKYTYGRLAVVAGSRNYVGAAYLVGAAATRSGAGLVTMAVAEPVQALLASQLIEATWLPLPHTNGFIAEGAADLLKAIAAKSDALVIGPGLGAEDETKAFLSELLGLLGDTKVLVDADGLRLLAQINDWHKRLPAMSVLTPHPGEMQALTGLDTGTIQKDRLGVARRYAAEWGHVVLLKGAFTIIAAPDGRAVLEPFATPALAKAGSGDVLSGIIGSLLAQGLGPFEAAVAGAFIHGRSGDAALRQVGTATSIRARDYVEALGEVFAGFEGE
jgi:ADP-dependent NAD(P)H-hydrate dehydratase / NAD(P)H-hydrate epimerase